MKLDKPDLHEGSTWRGIVMMIMSAGIAAFDAETLRWFLPLGMVLSGVLGVFVPEAEAVENDDTESLDDLVKRGRS